MAMSVPEGVVRALAASEARPEARIVLAAIGLSSDFTPLTVDERLAAVVDLEALVSARTYENLEVPF